MSAYENFIDEMNHKEERLQSEIKYYKENLDQVIRIGILEEELLELKNKVAKQKCIRVQEWKDKKNEQEFINLCRQNCKEAFQKNEYEVKYSKRPVNYTELNFQTPYNTNRVLYTFDKVEDTVYLVSCNVNCGMNITTANGPKYPKLVIGKYSSVTHVILPFN